MKAQWSWRMVAVFLGVFLVAMAGWGMAPSDAEAASCQGAPAPCVEDPAINGCVLCHSMTITGGNRNGTDRPITVSTGSMRHILGPPMASWLSTVQGMIAKGSSATAATTAAYMDTNYCPTCTGPIMSSPVISNVSSSGATVSWTTSANGFGDLAATSCVLYGTSLGSLTGDTCNPSDPSYDPNSSNVVMNHSVTLTGLSSLTLYHVVHRSTAGGNTATYAGSTTFTTLPGGGGGGPSGLGTIVSLTVGDYNGDLNLDIGVGVSTKNHVIPYLGNGAGAFTAGTTLTNVGATPSAITSGGVKGDFNGDGIDDLAVANFGAASQNVAIFLGTAPSGFQTTAVSTIPLAAPPTGVTIGDFNRDGILDLAVATVALDGSTGRLLIFTGNGTGNFTGPINTYNLEVSSAAGPVITSIVPDPVDCTGLPSNVTINGALLLPSATVTLDGSTTLTVVSGAPDFTSLVVAIPAGTTAGLHSITVTLGSLTPASAPLNVAPRTVTIDTVSPSSITYGVSASQQITLVGTGFVLGATVGIGTLSGVTVAGVVATAAVPFVHVNSSTIRVYVGNTAMPAGVYSPEVTNPDACNGVGTAVNGFTVVAPQPTVLSVSQPSVTYGITPSQSLTISGSNFIAGAVISVGGLTGPTVPGTVASAGTPFVYVSSSTLRFWWNNTSVPIGSYSVDVTNPAVAGGLTGSLASGFTVAAAQPTVTAVAPSPVTYGVSPSQSITVFGTNFLLGSTITVGSLSGSTVAGSVASAATPFVLVNSAQVKFWWPNTSLSPGPFDVQVTNPVAAGGLSATLAGGFVVSAPQPTVTSVAPTPVTYGITPNSSITVNGTNFVVGATITVGSLSGPTVLGSVASAATPYVFVNQNTVRFWWPNNSLSPGPYSVVVANPAEAGGLSGTLVSGFTVNAPVPTITAATPPSVTYGITPSSSVTILGSNFVLGATITVGSLSGPTVSGSSATVGVPYVFTSSGNVKFWWPNTALAPGAYAVQVENPVAAGGQSATLAGAFTVVAPQPTVTSVAPTPLTYGISPSISVTVFGTNFLVGSTITVGSLSGTTVTGSVASAGVPFVIVNSTQVKFWWPNTSLAPGSYAVTVTNPAAAGSLGATLAGGFAVNAPAPTISAVVPSPVAFGAVGQAITITGSNFLLGANITVGSLSGPTVTGATASAAVPFVIVNSTTLRFWRASGALPIGTYDVVVTNPLAAGGLSDTEVGGFVVN